MQFNLASAHDAAMHNRIENWVHEYLTGPGNNQAFASGLRLRPRYWDGPVLLPLNRLNRKCGPEPGMQFPVPVASWEQRIAEIVASFKTLEEFPPLIVEYRSGELIVSDGNHRLDAFATLGIPECWVIVWYPDEIERAHSHGIFG